MSKTRPKQIEIGIDDNYWEFKDGNRWTKMDQNSSATVEKEYLKSKTATIDLQISYTQYKVNLSSMEQENVSTGNKRQIRRTTQKINTKKIDVQELYKLFDKYAAKDDEDNGIQGEGIMSFCQDMSINPEDKNLLILFWKLNCDKKYYISERQFIYGLSELGMESAQKVKSLFPKLSSYISDPRSFKQFYGYCFDYFRDPAQKRLPTEIAVPTWKVLLSSYKYIDDWSAFCLNGKEKTVPKDTWNQFLSFTQDQTFKGFETFNASENEENAYPVIIDEFCDYMKKKIKK